MLVKKLISKIISDRLWSVAKLLVSVLILTGNCALSQNLATISIDSCYARAVKNYPLVKQFELLEKSNEYSLENASKGNLPKINIAGQASYQSEVIRFPFEFPGIDVPYLSKDQYKIYGEIIQPLSDLVTVKKNKELIEANMTVEKQKLEVDLYQLKERINQLFFGILLIDSRLKQNKLLQKDILSGMNKTTAAIANGVAMKSSIYLLKAELLKVEQQEIELKATREGFTEMLSMFINQPVDENTVLEVPANKSLTSDINRPELKIFEYQKKVIEIKDKLDKSGTQPKLSLFMQGGYGRPALNPLNDKFEFYYIGGLRLSWNISGYYTRQKKKQLLEINNFSLDVNKENFLFNTNLMMKQQNSEIEKLYQLIKTDDEIISLREDIKKSSEKQLLYGTITSIDYLSHINSEDRARQNLILHRIQLLMAQYNYKTTTGN